MSTKITIFDVPEQEQTVNKSQKQLEYEELEKQTGIDKIHIASMYEMDELQSISQRPSSTLPSIMLKYIIQYCMPIIIRDPQDKQYYVTLQAEDRIIAGLGSSLLAIPSNQQFKIIGIKIPSVFLKTYNKFALAHYDHIPDKDLSLSGRYGLADLQTMQFTQQRMSFTHPGLPDIGEDKIIFTSDDHCLRICKILIDYIEFIEKYYRIHFPLLRYDLIEPDVFGTSLDKWQVINGALQVIEKNVQSKKKIDMFTPFSRDLLDKLNEAQSGNFGVSFYYDMMFMLDANKLAKLYNVGLLAGTDTPAFKQEFNELKKHIQTRLDLQKQINAGHKIQLDIIKKKSIAYDKFGIEILTELSKEQAKIVELEFNKLESKSTESGENNRKLFYKLKKSMTNQTADDLRSILQEIEKTISQKDLNGSQLISGGVCPHTYHYAKKILSVFGRPGSLVDLRDFLINTYSLPADSNGYFCKICGEFLVEPDSSALLRFAGDRSQMSDENPLQTMIWKEAMYIVSSNVRFITPMPIKPLVNSLASGLREIVAHEEAKLYRSKTNLGDNVKDVLNLYAAIYIYAALCALMLQNPGKLMFAREPPAEKMHKKTFKPNKPANTKDTVNLDDTADLADESDNEVDSELLEPRDTSKEQLEVDSELLEPRNSAPTAVAVAAGESLIRRRQSKRKLRYIKGGKVVTDAKLAEKFYLTTALKLIFLTKETIISRLPNMSADVIKQIFIKNAYTWAMKHARPIQVDDESARQTSENPIYIDSFYRYIYYTKKIAPDSKRPTDLDDVRTILGRDEAKVLSDLKQNISMYSTVVAPKPWKISDIPEFDEYTYKSFLSMLEYYQEMLYTKSRVPKHVQVVEYMEKYKDLLDMQFRLRMLMAQRRLRPNLDIPLLNNIREKYNNFAPNKIDLAKHFCPNGDLHKTGAYIYTDGKKEVEINRKEIIEWLNTNNVEKLAEFAKLKVVDEKCEKCKANIRRAKSLQTSDKALAKMFGHIDDLLAFYQYYETRCPKGNLHDIQDNVCIKCKFDTAYIKSSNVDYYEKYKAGFQKVQREKLSLAIRSLEKIADENKSEFKSQESAKDYKFSLKQTAEWSQISGVKYNLIVNIGLYEKLKFVDLENANINPSKTSEPSLTRAMRFKNYIHIILRDYTMLMNHENVVDMPLELKEIFDAQKKIDIGKLQESMPKFDEFAELDREHSKLSIENYVNFLQEYLAGIIVRIHNESTEKYKTLASALVKYFTNLVIQGEKFISKPEPVFAKLAITTLEDNSEDEVGVSGDDWDGRQQEVSEAEQDVETYENEISHEAFDVENADDIWENE